ncbi:hypothetical protein GLAREA_09977 [Glarea lozoyensis ATCC 20868]|uniref:Uncharacterized protein n=1 Tax=Glarea lozoyensis (strain ATCC 20868 / MF5171) TaxID=1116229 RepID=S3E7K1_GLAL2|nr:uncharacterized protein GLAREA_09977 [Glarea lozoyensis ATCC 20868]EPE34283.1 hypothetical protein GLAREA_09977 [Glarea lozoyensis ATCC 20868]
MLLLIAGTYISSLIGVTLAFALPTPDNNALVTKSENQITSITIPPSNTTNNYGETLKLDFDAPIDPGVVDESLKSLFKSEESTLVRRLGPTYFSCEGSADYSDSNGKLSLQYTCSSKYYLAWGFRISAPVQKIIAGLVSERGLAWWRNGIKMPMNAPHPLVSKNYIFHGTMTGANPDTIVEYNDYITFRHNIGPGGSGSIYWQGKVHMLH